MSELKVKDFSILSYQVTIFPKDWYESNLNTFRDRLKNVGPYDAEPELNQIEGMPRNFLFLKLSTQKKIESEALPYEACNISFDKIEFSKLMFSESGQEKVDEIILKSNMYKSRSERPMEKKYWDIELKKLEDEDV